MPEKNNHRECLLCKKKGRAFILHYIKCWKCQLIWSPKLLRKKPRVWNKKDFLGYFQNKEYFETVFTRIISLIEQKVKKGKILDIGCSSGMLLNIARNRGWQVFGVENSKWVANYCHKCLKIPVFEGNFEDYQTRIKFDAIIINHTLEHMVNPLSVAKKIKSLLKNNGLLFISVPNIESIMFTFLKGNWPGLQKEQHIWQFNKKSMLKLLNKTGFKVEKIWCETGFTPKAPFLKKFKELTLWFCDQIDKGESMSLFARA